MNHRDIPTASVIVVTHDRASEAARCIRSLMASDFPSREIIVVDNASRDNTVSKLRQEFGDAITLVEELENKMAAGGRNSGAARAKGEFLVFVDSDNVVAPRMLGLLVAALHDNPAAGLAGPCMYYLDSPQRIWCAGAEINLWTGRTTYRFANEEHATPPCGGAPYETGHIPNIFACRSADFHALDGFHEPFGIMFEESDLAERIRRRGRTVWIVPAALACHDVPLLTDGSLRAYGLQTPLRAYYLARNRVLFERRNAGYCQLAVFLLVFLPLLTLYYERIILRHRRWDIAASYLRGVFQGRAPEHS